MNKIQFSHANGFPGRCYSYLFSQLPDYDVSYVEKMGHGDYPLNGDLRNYAAELICDIEHNPSFDNQAIIGMGHSAGAVVTLIAAALRPDLFRHVVLLDPVLFSKRKRYALRLFKQMGLIDRITPAGRTARRRRFFSSREEAANYFRNKSLFRTFHPACFDDYIAYGLHDSAGGFELAFSPDIEADIFRNVLLRAPNCLKQVSGTVIYGTHSNLFQRSDRNWWQRNFPNIELVALPGGHLFPFESPHETAALLTQILSDSPTTCSLRTNPAQN